MNMPVRLKQILEIILAHFDEEWDECNVNALGLSAQLEAQMYELPNEAKEQLRELGCFVSKSNLVEDAFVVIYHF